MKALPSAFAPGSAKNTAPCSTLRESQLTCSISTRSAALGKTVSTPRSSSLSFFRVLDPAAWTDGFRGVSWSVVVEWFTCFSRPGAMFILMPALPFWLEDLCRRCPELHRQLRTGPHLSPRRRHLTDCQTAANQEGVHPQLQTRLCHFPHRLSREVRHRDVAAFIHRHRHRRCLIHHSPRICPGGLGWG